MHICGNFHEDPISSFNVKLATDKKKQTDARWATVEPPLWK